MDAHPSAGGGYRSSRGRSSFSSPSRGRARNSEQHFSLSNRFSSLHPTATPQLFLLPPLASLPPIPSPEPDPIPPTTLLHPALIPLSSLAFPLFQIPRNPRTEPRTEPPTPRARAL